MMDDNQKPVEEVKAENVEAVEPTAEAKESTTETTKAAETTETASNEAVEATEAAEKPELNQEDNIPAATPKPEEPKEEKKEAPSKSKWYVLRVMGGKERKIKEYIDREVKRSGWEHMVNQVLCPIEKVYKVQNGKKVMKEKILYPGYMLVEATHGKLSGTVMQELRNITGVMHFIGKDQPQSLRKSEVNKMFGKIDSMADDDIQLLEPYIVGETVKIIDGPFNDFNGTIQEVDEDKKKIKAIVKIFGRDTPVELSYMQVEKVN